VTRRLASRIALASLLLTACDSQDASTKAAADGKAEKAGGKKDAQAKAGEAKADEAKADAEPTIQSCSKFAFTLGEGTSKITTKPNNDNPVGEADAKRPLSLSFECGGKAETLALGDLELTCDGAGCGDGCYLNDDTQTECAFDLKGEDFTAAMTPPKSGELASWLVLTGVGRATIDAYEVYRVQRARHGFEVSREQYTVDGKADTKVVATKELSLVAN
jgi:hypothetical protein